VSEKDHILKLLENEYSKQVIIAIIAAAVGLFLSTALWYILSIKRYLNTGIDYIINDWFIYNISFNNNEEIINKGRWEIKKSLFGDIKIKIHYYDENDNVIEFIRYKGLVYEESGSVVISLKGIKHYESVFCRLLSPNPSNMNIIYGIWLGKNLDNINTAASLLLTQTEIDKDIVKQQLLSYCKSTESSIRMYNEKI